MINSFNNFYNNLSSDSLFFFWIIVFLFIFLVVISIILINKNKKLVKILKEEQEKVEDNKEINNSILKQQQLEVPQEPKKIQVETKEVPLEEPTSNKEEEKIPVVKEEIKEVQEEVQEEVKENNLYQKNVLREISSKQPVSPIHIEKKEEYIARENLDNFDFNNINYDNGLGMTYEDPNISPLEEMEDAYEVNDNMKFANEIVEKMEEETKPSNIELTDYEKKQEEEAIISYDELMKVKDKIYNITDDEETDEFIDELKNFRLDL